MATLFEQITKDIGDAMKAKDTESLGTLRMLKAAMMNKEVEKGRALDDAESLAVVASLVKQRRDSIEQFRAGNRHDLADKEQSEIGILERYQPPAADPAAVATAIDEAMLETGATSPKEMGKVIAAAKAKLAGLTVDGKALSDAVKIRLSAK
ncbi:MAG: GatB/YqeY domain-containing protein [Acidobacteria bacterium]|nr:GatB/YqeY domain-containing protein [Acidobacteriota bacterium]